MGSRKTKSKGGRSATYAERSARAQREGFRNYAHYRKETAKPAVRKLLARSGVTSGRDRYAIAALAAGVARLPGTPGSKARDKKAGILSDAIRRSGKNPTPFWAALGSPKKRGRK